MASLFPPAAVLLRSLRDFASRRPAGEEDLSFRPRGAEVSRIEGFSDAVFGFAITLLVISNEVPKTTAQLVGMWHQLLPFVASFLLLFGLWRAQFDFFRRYGLEDRPTVRLTGALLMIVLLAVYPVRVLFGYFLDVLPTALIRGDDSMRAAATIDDLPKGVLLYALGAAGVAFVFARLYRHAGSRHAELALSPLERFDTYAIERRWTQMLRVTLAMSLACVVALAAGPRRTWGTSRGLVVLVMISGPILVNAFAWRREKARLARDRAALLPAHPALHISSPDADH